MFWTSFAVIAQIIAIVSDDLVRSAMGQAASAVTTTNSTNQENENIVNEDDSSEEFHRRLQYDRSARVNSLQRHVLSELGWREPPEIDLRKKQELLRNLQTPMFVTQQKHCYYPACDIPPVSLPNYVNRTLWFDSQSRNLRVYFNLPPDQDSNVTITSAVVKLHLRQREGCQCQTTSGEPVTSRLHIKLYKYIKPVRTVARLRPRNKQLIDAKMITWDGERPMTLEVTNAVKDIMYRRRRNGGFEIHVRDMNENVISAASIFHPTICSTLTEYECTEPNAEVPSDYADDEIDPNKSPVLEVCTTTRTIIDV